MSGFAQNITRIDGRQHPELIPDAAAYRAVFLMQSHNATPQETFTSEQLQAKIRLSQADRHIYNQALTAFRQQLDALVAAHNSFVVANPDATLDEAKRESDAFRQLISSLVQNTRNLLASAMTNDGVQKLDAFVQSEKTHMVVGVRSLQ